MFLWCPGVPAFKSELTKFLCSVSSLHEAVPHKSDGSLWAVFSSAAEDAATWCSWCTWVPCTSWWFCCHQPCSISVFVVGVATGLCSWSCSSPNHPWGVTDTAGPQLEDLQHCCLSEYCLKIQLGEVSQENVVHLFDFIRMVSSCDTVLGWPKYLAPLEFAFSCRVYRFNLHPRVPLFKKFQHPSLYRITVLTELSTTDSRWSKNAWCRVAVLQFTVHLMPEVTHDIMVKQDVDCKVMTVKLGFVIICIYTNMWSQQDHLKVHGENHDVFVSLGLLFIIILFLFWLFFFSFHAP